MIKGKSCRKIVGCIVFGSGSCQLFRNLAFRKFLSILVSLILIFVFLPSVLPAVDVGSDDVTSSVDETGFYENNVFIKRVRADSGTVLESGGKTSVSIPEVRYDFQVDVWSVTKNTRVDGFAVLDSDGNGLFDSVEWNVNDIDVDEVFETRVDIGKVEHRDAVADNINNYNGTYTSIITSDAQNYYDEALGVYRPIDINIESSDSSEYEFENTKNTIKSFFGSDGKNKFDIEGINISYDFPDDAFSGKNNNADIVTNGNTLSYVDLYNNVDVRFNIFEAGILEEFVVKEPMSVSELTEIVNIDKPCRYEINAEGAIFFFDKNTDDLVFYIPPPVMWEENDFDERCYDIHFDVEQKNDYVFYVTKVIEPGGVSWLRDSNRIYPVVVDDSFKSSDPTVDGYIKYDNSGGGTYTNNVTDTALLVGWNGASLRFRSYVEWNVSSITDGSTIDDADFEYHGANAVTNVGIFNMTYQPSDFDIGTPAQLYNDCGDGTQYASFAISVATKQSVDLGANGEGDLEGRLASDWFAIGLHRTSEGAGDNLGAIYSEEYGSANPQPTLSVTYTPPNFAPTAEYGGGAADWYAGTHIPSPIITYHNDSNGYEDVDDCKLAVHTSKGVQATFTLCYNPDNASSWIGAGSDYVSIDGVEIDELESGIRVYWTFTVDWDAPNLDEDNYRILMWTDDESGENSGWQTADDGAYTFENDLEVVSLALSINSNYVDDHDGTIDDSDWFAGGQAVTASGSVEYQDSSQTFDSNYNSSVRVQLWYDSNNDTTLENLTNTYSDNTISHGAFSIPAYTPGSGSNDIATNANFDVTLTYMPSGGSDVTAAGIQVTSKRDNQKPTSLLVSISPYEQTSQNVTITSSDPSDGSGSGVKNVTIWYRWSNDNSSWGAWMQNITDTASPWSWDFNFTNANGSGYYEFYSIAGDNVSNVEAAPAGNDTLCYYSTAPESPTSFTATAYNTTQINLTWEIGVSATHTYIRYTQGGTAPATRGAGTFLYNGTGTSTAAIGLDVNTSYSFSAWSYNSASGLWNETKVTAEDVKTKYLFSAGDGTAGSPFQIYNWTDLHYVREYLDSYFIVMNNISENTDGYSTYASDSADSGSGWSPIGRYSPYFTGSLDGQNYTISDLFIDRSDTNTVGFFGVINSSAEVINVFLLDVNITGDDNVGAFAGYLYLSSYVNNSYSSGNVTGNDGVGGLLGVVYTGSYTINSYSTACVTGNDQVGGLVGIIYQGYITNCYSTGNVSGNDQLGGFVGTVWTGCSIINSYSTGDVTRLTGSETNISGFCGWIFTGSTINNSYSTGNVYYDGAADPTDKGFVGGEFGSPTYENNFFDNESSNQVNGTGATAKNTNEMKTITTFSSAGWDITSNAVDDLNNGYPYLAWQNNEDTSIWLIYVPADINFSVTPESWNMGTVNIGDTNETENFYFNLTNDGNTAIDVEIKATNATNDTVGYQWTLASTAGYNQYALQFNRSDAGTWTIVNLTYDTFKENIGVSGYQTFDLKIFFATSSSKHDPLELTITFKSVAH